MYYVWMALEPEKRKRMIELYERTKHLCFCIAYGFLQDPLAAEDVVQETMIRVMENIDKVDFQDGPRSKSYVAIICRHLAVDAYRARKKERGEELKKEIAAPIRVENDAIGRIELYDALQAVERLPERYRIVLLLSAVHGMSGREISESLHIKESAVRKRLQRAREMLSRMMHR